MANFNLFFDKLLLHEGGFVNNKNDKGGATNLGVTIATWQAQGYDKDGNGTIDVNDLKKINKEDARYIAKKLYWDKVLGDKINNQSIAEFIFDWAYNSGPKTAILKLQHILGPTVSNDGVIGNQTINALNSGNQEVIFNKLFESRKNFFHAIVRANPKNKVFLKGWLNRLNSFKYKP